MIVFIDRRSQCYNILPLDRCLLHASHHIVLFKISGISQALLLISIYAIRCHCLSSREGIIFKILIYAHRSRTLILRIADHMIFLFNELLLSEIILLMKLIIWIVFIDGDVIVWPSLPSMLILRHINLM